MSTRDPTPRDQRDETPGNDPLTDTAARSEVRSVVQLQTDHGPHRVVVGHSAIATTDAVIGLAVAAAGIDGTDLLRGTVTPMFDTHHPDQTDRTTTGLRTDGGTPQVTVTFPAIPVIKQHLDDALATADAPGDLQVAVTAERITATGTPETIRWLHDVCKEMGLLLRADGERRPADIAVEMADTIYNSTDDLPPQQRPTKAIADGGDPGHASAVLDQLRQADRDGDLPERLAEKHGLRDEAGAAEEEDSDDDE